MRARQLYQAFLVAGWMLLIPTTFIACQPSRGSISGRVADEFGAPITGAVVRVKATPLETVSDGSGAFTLTGLPAGQPLFVTAWKSGYYINGVENVTPGASNLEIVLTAHHDTDNPDYAWLSAFADAGEEGNCENCHSAALTPDPSPMERGESLPFDDWSQDAHALTAQNPRFLTMYTGTDVNGNQSPPRRYGYSRDYGRMPLRPDLTQSYFGPGYKLDFPDTAGNCAACHAPAAAIDDAYGIDPTAVTGAEAEGVSCDFCHKVWNVRLDDSTDLPFPNMPGVLSFEFRRPPEGHQFFAGPFDDVAPGEDTYTPIQRQSQFCAPCHFGVFWDTTVYNSFGEWLTSPYSSVDGKSCQDCHMPHAGASYVARPDKGAVERDPQTIFSHLMPGASSPDFLQAAVSMDVSAVRAGDEITITVTIINDQTGHHVPTDSPLRQMILLVTTTDDQGQSLSLQEGPTIPAYGGVGDPAKGYYAGLPGKIYAKILMELWTEITPTGAYWNPTRIVSDNRIPAMGSDTSAFVFAAPAEGPASIEVRLLFRRAFIELMDQKGWNVADILMESQTLEVVAP